jgi:hypothetical protein
VYCSQPTKINSYDIENDAVRLIEIYNKSDWKNEDGKELENNILSLLNNV